MNRQRIVAIGGGDFRKYKTLAIDQEIVRLSAKKQPRLLFIPTASNDNESYAASITDHFTALGCIVETLNVVKKAPPHDEIKIAIEAADIIYVGGGNTLRMMHKWRRLGIDKFLAKARDRAVLCGTSAGSICWFKCGNSDSRKDKNPAADYIKVTALGFLDALHCPHYDTESDRQDSLKRMMRRYSGVAIALTDCAALEVIGETYRIITSEPSACGYKVYWKNGSFYEQKIEIVLEFKPLKELVSR